MDDYLAKPIEVEKLLAIIEKWLPSPFRPQSALSSGGGDDEIAISPLHPPPNPLPSREGEF
jgi:DNA-binding response OmpR family regulator